MPLVRVSNGGTPELVGVLHNNIATKSTSYTAPHDGIYIFVGLNITATSCNGKSGTTANTRVMNSTPYNIRSSIISAKAGDTISVTTNANTNISVFEIYAN